MKLQTLLFELLCAILLITTGGWLYLNAFANAGLMIAGTVLIVLSLGMRARELRSFISGMWDIPLHVDTQSQTTERG